MTQRKFKPETRGGYWVRNIETRETDGPYVLQALIGNHTGQPPSDDPLDWHTEIFTADGKYKFNSDESPFDLIEETENE
jgi:hypothetical protein